MPRKCYSTTGSLILHLVLAGTVTVFRTQAFPRPHGRSKAATTFTTRSNKPFFAPSIGFTRNAAVTADQNDVSTRFPNDLVDSLDILPLMEAVSLHAGTRRGRQAFLALVGANYKEEVPSQSNVKFKKMEYMSARSRRALGDIVGSTKMKNQLDSNGLSRRSISKTCPCPLAGSKEEAKQEYTLVAEAVELLKEERNSSYPPLYGSSSSPWDVETAAETDYDTWLSLASAEDSTLEHIIQAEKVMETIRKVKEWARWKGVKEKAPLLAEMANGIDYGVLVPLYEEIAGTVIIRRVRTLTDPNGRSSFSFELNAEKFHVIQVLRTQVEEMAEKVDGKGENSGPSEDELFSLVESLEAAEDEIRCALFQSILGRAKEIDASLEILARLDVIFAKAAFGRSTGGLIPLIGNEGKLDVKQFVHPVLLLLSENGRGSRDVVAIDLVLSSEERNRALIISGPNGGGKTAAMKSFGLAAILCKLGLPIPCRQAQHNPTFLPRVDFFHDIHVALGDRQSLVGGDSTMMARLNACASVIEKIGVNNDAEVASLVLIDEMGGGTDPEAGGAIAQAILEELLENKSCRIVATTHVPRLKVLSYESKDFGCATVLLEANAEENGNAAYYQRPAYELLYDSIGDSYALGAASRCVPTLPERCCSRAAQLMTASTTASPNDLGGDMSSSSSTDGAYLQALTESIERQSERAQKARSTAERHEEDTATCRRAMLSVASAYDQQFLFLERKLEDIYQKMQQSDAATFDLVGDTLAELRLVRKEVKSQSELLREKGLKLLPDWHDLAVGDNVVIVSEDDMDGVSATVLSEKDIPNTSTPSLKLDDVVVLPSFSAWDDNDLADPIGEDKKPLVLKRFQIAIWDYASIWDDDDTNGEGKMAATQVTSVKDSKRRLNDIMLNLKNSPSSSACKSRADPKSPDHGQKKFSSARERKAVKKQSTKLSKKQRKRG